MTLPLATRGAIAIALVLGATLSHVQEASAQGVQVFTATLSGAQQVPAVASPGTGTGTVVLNAAETQIKVNLTFSGLTSAASAAHIHGSAPAGSNAGVLFDFSSVTPAATSGTIPERTFAITPAQVADLRAGLFYFNIHTSPESGRRDSRADRFRGLAGQHDAERRAAGAARGQRRHRHGDGRVERGRKQAVRESELLGPDQQRRRLAHSRRRP